MAFAITVKSANNTHQKVGFLIKLYNNFDMKVIDVLAKEKSITNICSSGDDADKLCSVEVINVLLQLGTTPIPFPELKARRSVIAKKKMKFSTQQKKSSKKNSKELMTGR